MRAHGLGYAALGVTDRHSLAGIVRAHVLGGSGEDALVYEEPDESFDLTVERSKSERYLFIGSESTTSSEWRYARADDAQLQFAVVLAREEDHEYQIDHIDERFLIRTNWQALNFRIVEVPVDAVLVHHVEDDEDREHRDRDTEANAYDSERMSPTVETALGRHRAAGSQPAGGHWYR